jgi:DNA-directed RNA polymerase subunit M/transcription elongation factor TFIIS
MKVARDAVRKILATKYNREQASTYEKQMYESCNNLFKKDDVEAYKKYTYEKVGQLMSINGSVDVVLKDIRDGKMGWECAIYNRQKENLEKQMSKNLEKPIIKEGAFICRCGSKKTFFTQLQTSSGDEGMTTFVTCVTCGARWKFR